MFGRFRPTPQAGALAPENFVDTPKTTKMVLSIQTPHTRDRYDTQLGATKVVTHQNDVDPMDAFKDFEDWFSSAEPEDVYKFSGSSFRAAVVRKHIISYMITPEK